MGNQRARATRGDGVFEGFFARQRRDLALRLLERYLPARRVLDIGCGSYPLLLQTLSADERIGIDQLIDPDVAGEMATQSIALRAHDVVQQPQLPFDSESFDAITMLAVIEHLPLESSTALLGEVYRLIRPGGVFIATTPASWTGGILWGMARLGLVSAEEIDEHKIAFSRARLESYIAEAGFGKRVETGSFELGMNLWARAVKAK